MRNICLVIQTRLVVILVAHVRAQLPKGDGTRRGHVERIDPVRHRDAHGPVTARDGLGAQTGTTGYFAIQKMDGVTAKSYDEISYAIESAYTGRIDGVVCDEPTAASFALMRKEYSDKLKIAFILEDAEVEEYGMALKKGNTELRDILNKGIEQVRAKGIEAELQKKWFGSVQE